MAEGRGDDKSFDFEWICDVVGLTITKDAN
jgi:hypothetical protein